MASEDESKMHGRKLGCSVDNICGAVCNCRTSEVLATTSISCPWPVSGRVCSCLCFRNNYTERSSTCGIDSFHFARRISKEWSYGLLGGKAGMAAAGMSEDQTRKLLSDLQLSVSLSITAVNDPTSVTVAGDYSQSVNALGQYLETHAKNTFWRVFRTKRAFRSPHMDIILKPFKAAMRKIKLNPRPSNSNLLDRRR